jgi:hypothetical protein
MMEAIDQEKKNLEYNVCLNFYFFKLFFLIFLNCFDILISKINLKK